MGAAITERDSLPVMDTKGVTTLISDSGITRYRVNTAEWLIYDRKKPPYWAFEKGIYLENSILCSILKPVSRPIQLITIIRKNCGS